MHQVTLDRNHLTGRRRQFLIEDAADLLIDCSGDYEGRQANSYPLSDPLYPPHALPSRERERQNLSLDWQVSSHNYLMSVKSCRFREPRGQQAGNAAG
jgi:hypothetical protein